jgi:hypothetical protein
MQRIHSKRPYLPTKGYMAQHPRTPLSVRRALSDTVLRRTAVLMFKEEKIFQITFVLFVRDVQTLSLFGFALGTRNLKTSSGIYGKCAVISDLYAEADRM